MLQLDIANIILITVILIIFQALLDFKILTVSSSIKALMRSTFINSPLDDAGTSFTISGTVEACPSTTENQKGQEITSLESLYETILHKICRLKIHYLILKCKHYSLPILAHNRAAFHMLSWKFVIKIALWT